MIVFGLPLATLIDAFLVDETWTMSLSALAGALRPSIAGRGQASRHRQRRASRAAAFVIRNTVQPQHLSRPSPGPHRLLTCWSRAGTWYSSACVPRVTMTVLNFGFSGSLVDGVEQRAGRGLTPAATDPPKDEMVVTPSLAGAAFAGRAQRQRQRADGAGKRHFLRAVGRHLDGHRIGDLRRGLALVGALPDGQHLGVGDDDLGGDGRAGRALRVLGHFLDFAGIARQHDVDAVARRDEAADAGDLVGPDGDRPHAGRQHVGQRRAAVRPRQLGEQHRFVDLDRRQHHAAAFGEQRIDGGEGALRQRILRPRDFGELRAVEFHAVAQRRVGHHDGLELDLGRGGRRDRRRLLLGIGLGLALDPEIRGKDRDRAENGGDADHRYGLAPHAKPLMPVVFLFCWAHARPHC